MRLSYVDTAKFLAILFVLVGHADMSSGISSFFFSFHVLLICILAIPVIDCLLPLLNGGKKEIQLSGK